MRLLYANRSRALLLRDPASGSWILSAAFIIFFVGLEPRLSRQSEENGPAFRYHEPPWPSPSRGKNRTFRSLRYARRAPRPTDTGHPLLDATRIVRNAFVVSPLLARFSCWCSRRLTSYVLLVIARPICPNAGSRYAEFLEKYRRKPTVGLCCARSWGFDVRWTGEAWFQGLGDRMEHCNRIARNRFVLEFWKLNCNSESDRKLILDSLNFLENVEG